MNVDKRLETSESVTELSSKREAKVEEENTELHDEAMELTPFYSQMDAKKNTSSYDDT